MTELWAIEAAAAFWAQAGGAPAEFPRDLRRAVALTLPLAIVDLPRLRVASIDAWLRRHHVTMPLTGRDRPVRAALIAFQGTGIVFLDGADPPNELRFSLAHEVAHFLIEHWLPRQAAKCRFGPEILAVLDGQRAPTRTERTQALLANVPLELTLHLLDRTEDGLPVQMAIPAAERRADLLAIVLLAPDEAVWERLPAGASRPAIAKVLQETFGLPESVARAHARRLAPPERDPLVRQLFGHQSTAPA